VAACNLGREERHQQDRAPTHRQNDERHGVQRRPFLQQRGIERVGRYRREQDEVADVQSILKQGAPVAAAHDNSYARERQQHAEQLPWPEPLAEQQKSESDKHERAGRLQDNGVDRLRVLQAVIREGVVSGDAEQREQRKHGRVLADRRPVRAQVGEGEGKQNECRTDPAKCSERDRRHMAGGVASDIDVARPEQHRQSEQKIRSVIEAPKESPEKEGHVVSLEGG
jgi:hypothetical protein